MKSEEKYYKGAIEDYTKAIDIDPKDKKAYYERGNVKAKSGDGEADKEKKEEYYKGAIEDYTKAIDIDPKYKGAYYNRCLVNEELGDYEGVIDDCDKLIKLDKNFSMAYINRGNAKRQLGDGELNKEKKEKYYKGAIEDYDKTLEFQSKK